MFGVDEYVIYGSEGVCRVKAIGRVEISGLDPDKDYYTLVPFYRSGTIYTPTDSGIIMRSVISKEYAQGLVSRISEISSKLDVPVNDKEAGLYYKQILRTYECENLVRIIKYVFDKQRGLAAPKRHMPAIEIKYMKMAEDMLYGELGFVLGIPPKEVKDYIIEKNAV